MERGDSETGRVRQKQREPWIRLNNLKWNADTFRELWVLKLFLYNIPTMTELKAVTTFMLIRVFQYLAEKP